MRARSPAVGRLAVPAMLVLALGVSPGAAQERPADAETPVRLPPVQVIGTTPLPALGTPVDKYAGNVQSMSAEDMKKQNLLDLSDTLFRTLGSVNLGGSQGNPWQGDLTYRGFLASPLAGSPIGLSVYLDGVRFNDGFGDTVSWDLIPRSAIADIDVIPGSNPLFGLNTLGGALAVRTKRGAEFPGTEVSASGGVFGRFTVDVEHGGSRGPLDWFLAFSALDEDGWRERSPSELRQGFAKVGWKTDRTDLELSYVLAVNDLTGNGVAPERTLGRDRRAVHTFPDRTQNEMHLVTLRGSQWLTDAVLLSANASYRRSLRDTLNGDAQITCVDDATGRAVFDAGGRPLHLGRCQGASDGFRDEQGRPLSGGLEREAEGQERATRTATEDWGGAVQVSHRGRILGRGNAMTAGVAYDRHETRFAQLEAAADLVPAGASVGTRRTEGFETEVDVYTRQDNLGVYLTDTFDLTERLALTLAGRFQHAGIEIRDRSGAGDGLRGDHGFHRVSPAAGAAFRALPGLTLFASFSEGFRAPTPAELTCASPAAPCHLPNAFVADPPLDPVLARTWELGARGKVALGEGLAWSLGLFRTDLRDDILFTAVQTGGAGFFRNVDRTRRQGVEVGGQGGWKRLRYFASYAFVDATYQADVTLASVTEPDGVRVRAGDRLPGIPRHSAKLGAEVAVLDNLWIGADVIAVSGSYLRGDDGNRFAQVDGYALLNLHVRYVPFRQLELWGRVDNATDARYATAGALNFNAFAEPISVQRFVAPGPPIAGWVGAKVRF